MYKRISILICALFLVFSSKPAIAGEVVTQSIPEELIAAKKLDREAQILTDYLSKHNSPLQNHAQDFVDAAKEYNLDWRLVASIAGVESTFGKRIPGGFNGWGWGVYGTQAIYFTSWKDGIYTVSKGLRENYVNRGYTEPYSMNRIYAASPTWGSKVTFFMNELDRFAQSYPTETISKDVREVNSKVAATSGLLTYNQ